MTKYLGQKHLNNWKYSQCLQKNVKISSKTSKITTKISKTFKMTRSSPLKVETSKIVIVPLNPCKRD